MAGAAAISGDLRIEHNLIDGAGATASIGISLDSHQSASIRGNILVRLALPIELIQWDSIKKVHLTASDHNLFDAFALIADRYATPRQDQYFNSLTDWQQALSSQVASLAIDQPDPHSQVVPFSSLFEAPDLANYQYSADSPAKALMPDQTHAGPYQLGTEQLGIQPD